MLTLAQQVLQSLSLAQPSAGAQDPAAAFQNVALMMWVFAGMMPALVGYWIVYMVALGATTFAVSEIYLGRPVGDLPTSTGACAEGSAALLAPTAADRAPESAGSLSSASLIVWIRSPAWPVSSSPVARRAVAILFGAGHAGRASASDCAAVWRGRSALVLEDLPAGDSIQRSIELTDGTAGPGVSDGPVRDDDDVRGGRCSSRALSLPPRCIAGLGTARRVLADIVGGAASARSAATFTDAAHDHRSGD